MSGLEGSALMHLGLGAPDFRAWAGCPGPVGAWRVGSCCGRCSRGRMSGVMAGCPGPGRMSGPCSTSVAGLLLLFTSSGAGCPGEGRMSGASRCLAAGRLLWTMLEGPDVRGL